MEAPTKAAVTVLASITGAFKEANVAVANVAVPAKVEVPPTRKEPPTGGAVIVADGTSAVVVFAVRNADA